MRDAPIAGLISIPLKSQKDFFEKYTARFINIYMPLIAFVVEKKEELSQSSDDKVFYSA